MTKWFGGINRIAKRIGGVRRLILILVAAVLGIILLLDILVMERILGPLGYFYIALGTLTALYVIYPLYISRRLTRYYWERVKKNRLAVVGLAFILFLILLAIIGPFLTVNPTKVNFEEKNLPPPGFTIEESVYKSSGLFVGFSPVEETTVLRIFVKQAQHGDHNPGFLLQAQLLWSLGPHKAHQF